MTHGDHQAESIVVEDVRQSLRKTSVTFESNAESTEVSGIVFTTSGIGRRDRGHSEGLNYQYKAAGNHKGNGPYQIQVQPCSAKKRQAQLFIDHPGNKARHHQVSQGVNYYRR